jgi:hypothetical protein
MPMGRLVTRAPRAVCQRHHASFRRKSQSFLHGRATVVNGRISCSGRLYPGGIAPPPSAPSALRSDQGQPFDARKGSAHSRAGAHLLGRAKLL